MGRVMGGGLCPYNAIEKVGNYALGTSNSTVQVLEMTLMLK